ncbi:MAG: 4Fe-4S dicluster domain-containing protein [Deltaproteobacteria bacterium]|nr:4Fe-4S dicluster domain-containing protein [Deltaproteobacteria bacterium]
MKKSRPVQIVEISEALCNGCVLCMKACPTKAIRVKENRLAHIVGACIECGECIRTCPRSAIKFVTTGKTAPKSAYSCVGASSALYVQFGEQFMPNDVLLALRSLGLGYVHDTSYTSELYNVALGLYLSEQREKNEAPRPLISPFCPVVVQTIFHRFPALIEHIPPLLLPRQIVAREAKGRLSAKYNCSQEEIKVLHITPCAAQIASIQNPVLSDDYYIDEAIGIGSIHESIKSALRNLEDDKVLHHSGGVGLGWAMSGGEIVGLDMNCLAISGLQETIHYLEKIEMGLLRDVDYVECRTCTEGCIGGPLAVADKYEAKHHLQKLVRQFGLEKRVKVEYVKKLYARGWFFSKRKNYITGQRDSGESISERIERVNRVEETLEGLPGKECGVCGCPDCRTFAEDVVNGKASMGGCVFCSNEKLKGGHAGEG